MTPSGPCSPAIIIPRQRGAKWLVQASSEGIHVRFKQGNKVTEVVMGADAAARMGAALRQAAQEYRWAVVAGKGDHVGKL